LKSGSPFVDSLRLSFGAVRALFVTTVGAKAGRSVANALFFTACAAVVDFVGKDVDPVHKLVCILMP
jgi:hypothetical protein